LLIKLHFGLVFDLTAEIFKPCGLDDLGKPSTDGLHSDPNIEVFRNAAAHHCRAQFHRLKHQPERRQANQ